MYDDIYAVNWSTHDIQKDIPQNLEKPAELQPLSHLVCCNAVLPVALVVITFINKYNLSNAVCKY